LANPESQQKKPSPIISYKKKFAIGNQITVKKLYMDLSFGGWVILMLEARQYRA